MTFYDQNRPFGAPMATREALPVDGLSWSEAAYYMRINGQGFHPPAHVRGVSRGRGGGAAGREARERGGGEGGST